MTEIVYGRTKAREDSLLLYVETCCVDARAVLDARKVNAAEIAWLEEWDEQGFIEFNAATLRVWLSDTAWEAAHRARRERAERTRKSELGG
jgi:hypothetical protein